MPESYARFGGNTSEGYGWLQVVLTRLPILPQVNQGSAGHEPTGSLLLGVMRLVHLRLRQP
jgi:hypothetical protein